MLNNQSSVSRGFALRNAIAGGTAASAIASEADAGSRKKAITIAGYRCMGFGAGFVSCSHTDIARKQLEQLLNTLNMREH